MDAVGELRVSGDGKRRTRPIIKVKCKIQN
jgi:hypothetical protein